MISVRVIWETLNASMSGPDHLTVNLAPVEGTLALVVSQDLVIAAVGKNEKHWAVEDELDH